MTYKIRRKITNPYYIPLSDRIEYLLDEQDIAGYGELDGLIIWYDDPTF